MIAILSLLLSVSAHGVQSLSYDPAADYDEVYPDPTDEGVLKGRVPLHFALILSLGGQYSQFDSAGSVAGMKVALNSINNDNSLLPGYTLHYTASHSKVTIFLASQLKF